MAKISCLSYSSVAVAAELLVNLICLKWIELCIIAYFMYRRMVLSFNSWIWWNLLYQPHLCDEPLKVHYFFMALDLYWFRAMKWSVRRFKIKELLLMGKNALFMINSKWSSKGEFDHQQEIIVSYNPSVLARIFFVQFSLFYVQYRMYVDDTLSPFANNKVTHLQRVSRRILQKFTSSKILQTNNK